MSQMLLRTTYTNKTVTLSQTHSSAEDDSSALRYVQHQFPTVSASSLMSKRDGRTMERRGAAAMEEEERR